MTTIGFIVIAFAFACAVWLLFARDYWHWYMQGYVFWVGTLRTSGETTFVTTPYNTFAEWAPDSAAKNIFSQAFFGVRMSGFWRQGEFIWTSWARQRTENLRMVVTTSGKIRLSDSLGNNLCSTTAGDCFAGFLRRCADSSLPLPMNLQHALQALLSELDATDRKLTDTSDALVETSDRIERTSRFKSSKEARAIYEWLVRRSLELLPVNHRARRRVEAKLVGFAELPT
jgi:hypothetical protein